MSPLSIPGDIVTGDELTKDDYLQIGLAARDLQAHWDHRFETREPAPQILQDVELLSFFDLKSLRTRLTQLIAVERWGARSRILDWGDIFSRSDGATREAKPEAVQTMEGYADILAARVNDHERLTELQNNRTKSLIYNLLSPHSHPQQALAHLTLLIEKFGEEKLHTISWAWVGDFTNVAYSIVMMLAKVGVKKISVATPANEKYAASEERRTRLEALAAETGTEIFWTNDPKQAVAGADVVGTDTFTSMGQEAEEQERLRVFVPDFQVNDELLRHTGRDPDDVLFHHCLPAHRGQEVTDQVLDSHREVIREAELRGPAQGASMQWSIAQREKWREQRRR